MKIIIDAMGGDNAPEEIVKGAALASLEYDADLVLVGDEVKIGAVLSGCEYDKDKITTLHADSVVTMEDEPTAPVRGKKDSSMAVGLKMLRDGGDAFISAGNTGALHVGASLYVRTLPGVERAAIATVLPLGKPVLLLDSGANVVALPSYYVSWAYMATVYMKNVLGVENPTVGLLNNGVEEHKGTPAAVEAYKLLSSDERINFIGNIEAKELFSDPCDIVVTDGFTGNVFIKTMEGMAKYLFRGIKKAFMASVFTKTAALMLKGSLTELKNDFDASEYGGSPLLGLKKPVIKAHGSSDALEIKNAIRQAVVFCGTGAIEMIASSLPDTDAHRSAEE